MADAGVRSSVMLREVFLFGRALDVVVWHGPIFCFLPSYCAIIWALMPYASCQWKIIKFIHSFISNRTQLDTTPTVALFLGAISATVVISLGLSSRSSVQMYRIQESNALGITAPMVGVPGAYVLTQVHSCICEHVPQAGT